MSSTANFFTKHEGHCCIATSGSTPPHLVVLIVAPTYYRPRCSCAWSSSVVQVLRCLHRAPLSRRPGVSSPPSLALPQLSLDASPCLPLHLRPAHPRRQHRRLILVYFIPSGNRELQWHLLPRCSAPQPSSRPSLLVPLDVDAWLGPSA